MRCPFKDSLDYRMRQYLKNKNKDRQTDIPKATLRPVTWSEKADNTC